MPTVAILADIHGNLPALRAVVEELDHLAPDEVLVGGDLVGRGPEGRGVVREIQRRGWPSVRGNHEDYLLDFRQRRVPDSWWREREWAASRWMAAELDQDAERFIDSLPFSLRPASAPGLLLVHGSPISNNEGLGPWTSDRELARHLAGIGGRLLVCAHTHRGMRRTVEAGEVVNVGSVGLPFNRDRRAQYALFHHDGDAWRSELRFVEYDVEETRAVYRRSGFLSEGGVVAELLELELQHASPYVVPFLHWTESLGLPRDHRRMEQFLREFDPDAELHEFFRRLRSRG